MPDMTNHVPTAEYGQGSRHFSLATGSPGELGLLKALGETFGQVADATMLWHKNGTGQSLKLLKEKQVDMVMVHAPVEIERALAQGWATSKTLIGSNEFYIVGPQSDPAGIADAKDAIDAYRRIATGGFPFISRGDNSGTHQKEMALWAEAQIVPGGAGYIATGDFMTASLKIANSNSAYFMTDSSTWIMEQSVAPALQILFRGDRRLVNVYHALLAPPGTTAGRDAAAAFVAFVASPAGQQIIREYGAGLHPQALYNDADYARQYE
jgi:tungstate transport system substrate-binding protein